MKPIKLTGAAQFVENVVPCNIQKSAKEIKLDAPPKYELPPYCAPPELYRAYAIQESEKVINALKDWLKELQREPLREFYTDADGNTCVIEYPRENLDL